MLLARRATQRLADAQSSGPRHARHGGHERTHGRTPYAGHDETTRVVDDTT
jgi:hypothetical protein